MKRLKFFIIIVVAIIFNNCASKESHIKTDIIKENLEDKSYKNKILKIDKMLFYVTKENSNGDIWLYDIDNNSKWQITDLDNKGIKITFIAPDLSFFIFKEENTDYIYDVKNEELQKIYLKTFSSEEKLLNIKYVNVINSNSFYCIATPTTNRNISAIYKVYKTDEKWIAEIIEIPPEYSFINKTKYYNLILSPDKNKLAFINNNEFGKYEIYVMNIQANSLKKLYQLKLLSDIVWGEDSSSLFYYEDTVIYNINLQRFTKLILTSDKQIVKLIPHPRQKFKFFYVTNFDNYFFIYLKNIDILGRGKFLFNNTNIKNIKISPSGKNIFWDNSNFEIYYFNISSMQIQKLLDNSSLISLNE